MEGKPRTTRIGVDIDAALYERFKNVAKAEHRTINKQFEYFIERCLESFVTEQEHEVKQA